MSSEIEQLSGADAWLLLATTSIGRLALCTDDGPDIFPVNFLASNGVIYFRSAPGSKLMELTAQNAVAFQADGKRRFKNWSVVVHGQAQRMDIDAEIEASGVRELETATPTEKWNYVRIIPAAVTGRRF